MADDCEVFSDHFVVTVEGDGDEKIENDEPHEKNEGKEIKIAEKVTTAHGTVGLVALKRLLGGLAVGLGHGKNVDVVIPILASHELRED